MLPCAWLVAALPSSAVCVAVLIGFEASLVLLTLPRPTIAAVMPLTVPVNVGLASGAFAASELVTVVEKFASEPKAEANSASVSSVAGAAFTTAATAEETSLVRAIAEEILASGIVPEVSRLAFVVGGAAAMTALVKSLMSAATCWCVDGGKVEGRSVIPFHDVVPAGPVAPVAPDGPATPWSPLSPLGPATPTGPVAPAGPWIPATPWIP